MKCEFCNNDATKYFISGFGSVPIPVCDTHKYSSVSYGVGEVCPLSESPFPMSEKSKQIRDEELMPISELEKMMKI